MNMKDRPISFRRIVLATGLLLPLLSLGMELLTGACGLQFVDPIPTRWHVMLALLMPAGIALPWLARRRPEFVDVRVVAFFHGAALIAALFGVAAMGMLNVLVVIMLPFTLIFMFGGLDGLLGAALAWSALGPLACLIAWFISRVKSEENLRSPWFGGMAFAFGLLLVAEVPMLKLRSDVDAALASVTSGEGDAAETLPRLRGPWREEFLLRLCYTGAQAGRFGPTVQIMEAGRRYWELGGGMRGLRENEREELRSLYFRVTGRVFSDVKPPRGVLMTRGGIIATRDTRFDDFAWDDERGGSEVGARIRGLSLFSSRLDWHVDGDSALAHGEWTLEFKNQYSNAQEARCQMLLPAGGCVSRLTLWINGEPREAAYASRSQVTAAYRQTVLVDRRDPVLVNMVGPDRVLTQCFPVPPGGTMKIRLGITAPLQMQQALFMPQIIERNFTIHEGAKHTVWVQARRPLSGGESYKDAASTQDAAWVWQAEVPQVALGSLVFRTQEAPLPKVWTRDKLAAGDEQPIVVAERTLSAATVSANKPLLIVVDGSAALRPHAELIRDVLKKLAAKNPKLAVWVSNDSGADEVMPDELAKGLDSARFAGGRDSASAILAALQHKRVSEKGEATLLWLHGPQPAEAGRKEAVKQLLERGGSPPHIHALALEPGRNRLLEELYDAAPVTGGLRWDREGMESLVAIIQKLHDGDVSTVRYSRSAEPPADGKEVWDQLARHAVFSEVMSVFQGRDRVVADQAKRAAQHQLVTPYSGAVVLENQQQYDRVGLKPVDAGSTAQLPTTAAPEPAGALLVLLGLLWMMQRRRNPFLA
jgi:MYXO-CTERM domain-containing protein